MVVNERTNPFGRIQEAREKFYEALIAAREADRISRLYPPNSEDTRTPVRQAHARVCQAAEQYDRELIRQTASAARPS